MTNRNFKRRQSDRIINIGTAGGATKATTGYTFRRIQHESKAIVQSLEKDAKLKLLPTSSQRFKVYDNLLLYIILTKGGIVRRIFDRLYAQNDFRKILRFLDESTKLREELWIMVRLPWAPFLKSIRDYYILRKPLPRVERKSSQPSSSREQKLS